MVSLLLTLSICLLASLLLLLLQQRQEREIHSLLEKIPADMISLDTTPIGTYDKKRKAAPVLPPEPNKGTQALHSWGRSRTKSHLASTCIRVNVFYSIDTDVMLAFASTWPIKFLDRVCCCDEAGLPENKCAAPVKSRLFVLV